jgi:hypothetical protein
MRQKLKQMIFQGWFMVIFMCVIKTPFCLTEAIIHKFVCFTKARCKFSVGYLLLIRLIEQSYNIYIYVYLYKPLLNTTAERLVQRAALATVF